MSTQQRIREPDLPWICPDIYNKSLWYTPVRTCIAAPRCMPAEAVHPARTVQNDKSKGQASNASSHAHPFCIPQFLVSRTRRSAPIRLIACQPTDTRSQGMRPQHLGHTSVPFSAWRALAAWPLPASLCRQGIQVPGSGRRQLSCNSSALAAEFAAHVQAPVPEAVAAHQSHNKLLRLETTQVGTSHVRSVHVTLCSHLPPSP